MIFILFCTRFFVTLHKLLHLGIKNKMSFILFCTRFFVTLQNSIELVWKMDFCLNTDLFVK